MHLSYIFYLSIYRDNLYGDQGRQLNAPFRPQPFEHPSFTHLLPHASRGVRSIGIDTEERRKSHMARGKGAGMGLSFGCVWTFRLAWGSPGRAALVRAELQLCSALESHRSSFPSTPLPQMSEVTWWRWMLGANPAVSPVLHRQLLPLHPAFTLGCLRPSHCSVGTLKQDIHSPLVEGSVKR